MKPGEYLYAAGEITLNKNRKTKQLRVKNTDSRPIQVGSHFHFFEANKALTFDRKKSFGMRLDIPSGAAVRFEPGEEKEVKLVSLGGKKSVYGLNALTNGSVSSEKIFKKALLKMKTKGFNEPPRSKLRGI
jgi:urease subunit beta